MLQNVNTDEQVADVLTKPLSRIKFEYFLDKLGVFRKYLPRKGSSDVAVGVYRPWTFVLK